MEDRRTPVLGWIEILQVLPEPTEYLQEAGFGVPRPLYPRMSLPSNSATIALPPLPLDEDADENSGLDKIAKHANYQSFPTVEHTRRNDRRHSNCVDSHPRIRSRPPFQPVLHRGQQYTSLPNGAPNSSLSSERLCVGESSPDDARLPIDADTDSRPDDFSNLPPLSQTLPEGPPIPDDQDSKATQQILSTTFVRRSTTIRRRLHVAGSGPSPSTVVTNVSHSLSSASSCVLTSVPCRVASVDGDSVAEWNKSGPPPASGPSEATRLGPSGMVAELGDASKNSKLSRNIFQSSRMDSRDASMKSGFDQNWNWDNEESFNRPSVKSQQILKSAQHPISRHPMSQHPSLSHPPKSHYPTSSHHFSGSSYCVDQHRQESAVHLGVRTAMRRRMCREASVHVAAQDSAVQKRTRFKRLFVEECSRFYVRNMHVHIMHVLMFYAYSVYNAVLYIVTQSNGQEMDLAVLYTNKLYIQASISSNMCRQIDHS